MTKQDKEQVYEMVKNCLMLRWYQVKINEAVEKFLNSEEKRGQVYSPTGSGKTVCFEDTIRVLSEEAEKIGKIIKVCIVHPRIALSQDQVKRFQKLRGSKYTISSFHSGTHVQGGLDDDGNVIDYIGKSTTQVDELLSIINNSEKTHLTFSSYDSFDKIQHIDFDVVIFDEAHNLTKNEFFPILQNLGAKKALFYTATPINFDEEDKTLLNEHPDEFEFKSTAIGMNNVQMFGKVLATVQPKELVAEGFIVPPVAHFLKIKTDKKGEKVKASHLVAEAFKLQEKEVKKYGMPYHQMLVTSRGVEVDHAEIMNNLDYIWTSIGKKIDVFCIASNGKKFSYGLYLNGVPYRGSRAQMLDQVKNSEQDAIIVHYDTLAEGLDIDSITGNLILRNMLKYKIIQLIGRAGRPYRQDLVNYVPVNSDIRKKRVSVITFPIVDGVYLCGKDEKEIAKAFIEGGYDDLSTTISQYVIDEALGVSPTPPGDEEGDMILSNIQSVDMQRYVNKFILKFGIEEGEIA